MKIRPGSKGKQVRLNTYAEEADATTTNK
jgi:hypothetical protein